MSIKNQDASALPHRGSCGVACGGLGPESCAARDARTVGYGPHPIPAPPVGLALALGHDIRYAGGSHRWPTLVPVCRPRSTKRRVLPPELALTHRTPKLPKYVPDVLSERIALGLLERLLGRAEPDRGLLAESAPEPRRIVVHPLGFDSSPRLLQ